MNRYVYIYIYIIIFSRKVHVKRCVSVYDRSYDMKPEKDVVQVT